MSTWSSRKFHQSGCVLLPGILQRKNCPYASCIQNMISKTESDLQNLYYAISEIKGFHNYQKKFVLNYCPYGKFGECLITITSFKITDDSGYIENN